MESPEGSKSPETPGSPNPMTLNPENTTVESGKLTFSICDDTKCEFKGRNSSFQNICELALPSTASRISVQKCSIDGCHHRTKFPLLTTNDEPILITFNSLSTKDCCTGRANTGGNFRDMYDVDPCDCTCDCSMGLVKKTTYCKTCGGFEIADENWKSQDGPSCIVCNKFAEKEQRILEGNEVQSKSDHDKSK